MADFLFVAPVLNERSERFHEIFHHVFFIALSTTRLLNHILLFIVLVFFRFFHRTIRNFSTNLLIGLVRVFFAMSLGSFGFVLGLGRKCVRNIAGGVVVLKVAYCGIFSFIFR